MEFLCIPAPVFFPPVPVVDKRKLYRYDSVPGSNDLHLWQFWILSETPKGVWVDKWGDKKFVLLTAHKKFACRTPREALESFVARKNRHIAVLSGQLETTTAQRSRGLEELAK